jgi:hypothetical protein
MNHQNILEIYLNHIISDTNLFIESYINRDEESGLSHAPLVKKLLDIEIAIHNIKLRLVDDASKLG